MNYNKIDSKSSPAWKLRLFNEDLEDWIKKRNQLFFDGASKGNTWVAGVEGGCCLTPEEHR